MADSVLAKALREIRALARRPEPLEASWRAAKLAILEAALSLRQQTNQNRPPIDVLAIARLRRIYRISYSADPGAPEGVLAPSIDGFVLRLPRAKSQRRQRSVIAHEIGHTFFFDLQGHPPTRLLALGTTDRLSRKEEDICNAFARELLMPQDLVALESTALGDPSPLNLLQHLADRFQVSEEFAAVRLLRDLSEWQTTAAIFKEPNPSSSAATSHIVRRHLGRLLQRYLRKKERQIIQLVRDAVDSGGASKALPELGRTYAEIMQIEFKIKGRGPDQRVLALVHFQR